MPKFLTTEEFIKKAKIVHGDKYTYYKTEYTNSLTKLAITCKQHGDFLQRASAHLAGNGCPLCFRTNTTKDFIHKASEVHRQKYDYSLVEWKSSYSKVKIICTNHGVFEQIAGNHLQGNGCPTCNSPKGELKIIEYLVGKRIRYTTEKSFSDCINPDTGYVLRYDFYLPDHNILIEFDGAQHFKPTSFSPDSSSEARLRHFCAAKHRDAIKDRYAFDHGIKLVRIPYFEIERIYEILDEGINKRL